MSRSILVIGATGQQGGAVIKALLDNGSDFKLLAATRNASSPSAERLKAKSPRISLVEGDLADTEALFAKAEKAAGGPVWGAFGVQAASPKKNAQGVPIEEAQGKDLVDSALKHGVKHFVYTSVDRHGARSSENPTVIPHFITKHNIEKHLIKEAKKTGTTWTILRPVAFMDNLNGSFFSKVFATGWRQSITKRPLQLICAEDIGIFGAKAFTELDAYKGKAVSLAGDELTFAELDRVYKQTTGAGVPTTFGIVATLVSLISEEMRTMLKWFNEEGYAADIPALKKVHTGMKDFATYLKESQKKA